MNDNIFKYNERKKSEHDEKFNVFCEVYDSKKNYTKKEWLDILKKRGVNITRMTLFRYTQKFFERITHEAIVTHEEGVKPHRKRSVSHKGADVSLEIGSVSLKEIVESTKKNPIIREILLQERTTGTRFCINPDEVVPRYKRWVWIFHLYKQLIYCCL